MLGREGDWEFKIWDDIGRWEGLRGDGKESKRKYHQLQ